MIHKSLILADWIPQMDPVVVSLFLAYHASRMRLLYPKRGQGGVPNLKQGFYPPIQGPFSKLSSILYVFFVDFPIQC